MGTGRKEPENMNVIVKDSEMAYFWTPLPYFLRFIG